MRRVVLVALLAAGCGDFLPFFGDDDDPAPPPAIAADAGDDASPFDASGSSDGSGGTVDAGEAEAAVALVWFCGKRPAGSTYSDEPTCMQARLGNATCDAVNPAPIGQPCTMVDERQVFCDPCEKASVGASYSYTTTNCQCVVQP